MTRPDYLDADEYAEYLSVQKEEVCQIFLDRIGMIDTAKSIIADRREDAAECHRRDIVDDFDRPLEHDADTIFYAEMADLIDRAKNTHIIYIDGLLYDEDDHTDPRDYDPLDCLFFEDE